MITDIASGLIFSPLIWRLTRWHWAYFSKRKPSLLACGFYITSRCNFSCVFCNIRKMTPSFQVSEDTAKKIVAELGRMGVIYFSISGGEPLLVPYCFEILACAKKNGVLYTHLVSNGSLLKQEEAKKIAKAGISEISLSLDGPPTYHDAKRSFPGAFDSVMEAVGLLKKHAPKCKIVLNTILDPYHPKEALAAIQIAKDKSVRIKIQPLNEHPDFGMKETVSKQKDASESIVSRELIAIIDDIKKMPHVVNSASFLRNFKSFLFAKDKLALNKQDCIFGYHHAEFFNNQLFPCLEGCGWKDGYEISRSSIKDMLRSSEYNKKVEHLKKCENCKKNYYVCYYEPRLNFPVWNFARSRT